MKRVHYILGTLDDDDIDWLVTISQRRKVKPSEALIEAGQPSNAIYLILEGAFAVFAKHALQHPVAHLSSGDVAGEMSFIDGYAPSATVQAVEPGLVLAIPKDQLAVKLKQDICFAARFYEAISTLLSIRLRGTLKQVPQSADGVGHNLEMENRWELGIVRYDWLLRRLRHEAFGPL
ncbi:MAG: cyclic nucleotide-binding domain-containing protein [Cyanobacteria bacterium P01_A01_bin.114]